MLWAPASQSACANILFKLRPVLDPLQMRELRPGSDGFEQLGNLVFFSFVSLGHDLSAFGLLLRHWDCLCRWDRQSGHQ
jgi:hypothetical protein